MMTTKLEGTNQILCDLIMQLMIMYKLESFTANAADLRGYAITFNFSADGQSVLVELEKPKAVSH